MLGALLLLAGIGAGLTALRLVPLRWRVTEYLAASCIVGLLAAAWSALLGVWILGYRGGIPAAVLALATGSVAAWVGCARWRSTIARREFEQPRDRRTWLILSALLAALFAWLHITHMLDARQGAYYCGTNTYGDLALHLSLLTRFAYEAHFTWDFPIFFGAKLSYPFLIDFLSGVLHRTGWTLQWALIVPGLALTLSFLQLLYFTVYRWFRSSAAAVMATVVFLGSGAPAGIVHFWRDWRASGESLSHFLTHMDKMYGHLPDAGLHFSNVVTDYLVPQRSVLFGLPLFLLVLLLLREAWRRSERSRPFLLASAILAGLAPFAHVHGFFVIVGTWGWLATIQSVRRRTLLQPWVGFWLLGACLAAPQLAWQFWGSYSKGFSHWHLWWLKPPDENPAIFWLRNVGLAIPLALWIVVWLSRTRGSRGFYLHVFLAVLVLFAMTNVYLFQPNAFDNMKFMVFSYLVLSVLVGYTLTRWIAWSAWGAAAAVVAVVTLSAAGALSIATDARVLWRFSAPEDIAAAEALRAVIPPEARVLTSDQHNHFIPTLTGRRIVMGYRGWLWSYGIDYGQVEKDVMAMYAGGPEAVRLFPKYRVSYVCVGPSERKDFHANEEFFERSYPVALRSGPFAVYDVSVGESGTGSSPGKTFDR
jgi:hypothetical protein